VVGKGRDWVGRGRGWSILVEREFLTAGAPVEYVTVPTDYSPMGNFQRQVLGAVAEFERHKILERTSRGRREKARRGLVVGGPWPFGYRPDPPQPGGAGLVPGGVAV